MKMVVLSGSIVGSKTRTALNYMVQELAAKYADVEVNLIDLAEYEVRFSDGRNYLDYEGDTKHVLSSIMEADALIIGTPIFQASIPATLKNVFDLLPQKALDGKVVSMLATAGSSKHYLILEQQLKPILSYMKAQIVHNYVFVEEADFVEKKIINDDVLFRISRLVEDTVVLADTYAKIREAKEAAYGF